MKKKLTILFSIMCILVLAACGQTKSNEEATKKTEKSNDPKIASIPSIICII